jgi:hypothetical protein
MNPDASKYRIGSGYIKYKNDDLGGTTEEGVTIKVDRDIFLHTSGKYGSTPIKASLKGVKVEIEAEFGEVSATQLATFLPGVLSGSNFGIQAGDEIPGGKLEFLPFDGTEAWIFTNAVPTSPVEQVYKPDKPTTYKVTFTAMIDGVAADGKELGYLS